MSLTVTAAAPKAIRAACLAAVTGGTLLFGKRLSLVQFAGAGVIILTDLFGGTPSNLAISLMSRNKVEVIAGINLPMLIRLAKARGCMPLEKAVIAARDAGRNYITVASEFLGQDA